MGLRLENALDWEPGAGYRRVRTFDLHTGGEPFRIVIDGAPAIPGETVAAKRRWAQEHADDLRRLLMWEPRGHADMYGCLLTAPVTPGADFGILFMHNSGFSTMCGHGIIAATTAVLETGMLPAAENRLIIDSPAGPVRATAERDGNRVSRVAFLNVPSFVVALDAEVEVASYGRLPYDLAFGGAYYAFVDIATLGLDWGSAGSARLIDAGRAIKRAIAAEQPIEHPGERDLGFLYGVVFHGPPTDESHHSRNVCVFADGEVDRSPTGTGVSARAALLHARGHLALGQPITIESIVGSVF